MTGTVILLAPDQLSNDDFVAPIGHRLLSLKSANAVTRPLKKTCELRSSQSQGSWANQMA